MTFSKNLCSALLSALTFAVGICSFPLPVTADENTSGETKLPPGYVMSYDSPMSGNSTADHLALAAQYMVNHEYYDKAISVCQKALRKNDDDADIHKIYAEALEGKLRKERKDNPDLYEQCIREWLVVLRNKKGDERGMTFLGVGIPGLMGANEDEDHQQDARGHLRELTGLSPRPWETDEIFIKRVFKAKGNFSVTGKLVDKKYEAPRGSAPLEEPAKSHDRITAPAAPAGRSKGDPLDWLKQ